MIACIRVRLCLASAATGLPGTPVTTYMKWDMDMDMGMDMGMVTAIDITPVLGRLLG